MNNSIQFFKTPINKQQALEIAEGFGAGGGGGSDGRYRGTWNANTNSPTLPNPPATPDYELGDYYQVTTAGTQFGITFAIGDEIISVQNGLSQEWQKRSQATGTVTSVNNIDPNSSGNVSINSEDIPFTSIPSIPENNVQAAIDSLAPIIGVITSFTITPGIDYDDGGYSDVPLTGGNGTGATANIAVSGNLVTQVLMVNRGKNYEVGDILSADIPGGSGFSIDVIEVSGGWVRSVNNSFPNSEGNIALANGTTNQLIANDGNGNFRNITVRNNLTINSSLGNYYLDAEIPADFLNIIDANIDGLGALPNTYADVNSATSLGKRRLLITASSSLSGSIVEDFDINLAGDTIIYGLPGVTWERKRINKNNHSLAIFGLQEDKFSFIEKYTPANSGESSVYGGSNSYTITKNLNYVNNGSLADTPYDDTSFHIASNCLIIPGNANNAGFKSNQVGGRYDDITCGIIGVETQRGIWVEKGYFGKITISKDVPSSDPSYIDFTLGENSFGDNVFFQNGNCKAEIGGNIASIDCLSAKVDIELTQDDLFITNASLGSSSLKGDIEFQGAENIKIIGASNIGTTTVDGSDAELTNINCDVLDITNAASDTIIIGSFASSYSNEGADTQATACKGAIINTITNVHTNFSCLVAATGGDYATIESAYSNDSKKPLTDGNITEVSNITMAASDYLNVTIGSESEWNLSTYQINGAANGDKVHINFNDSSSSLKYSSTEPFANFDALSNIDINGNNGVIENAGTTDNSPISTLGKMNIIDIRFLLADQYNSGLKTNSDTILNGIEFIGGGNDSEVGLLCQGGAMANIRYSGSWKPNANLNAMVDSTTLCDISNVIVDIAQDAVFSVQGSLTNINQAGSGSLTVNMSSDSELYGANCDNVVCLSGAEEISIDGNGIGNIFLANDNSNNRIKISNGNFANIVSIYGTNITFENCHFESGFETFAGSTGTFINCTAGVGASITQNGTFRKIGNDSSIGNDY